MVRINHFSLSLLFIIPFCIILNKMLQKSIFSSSYMLVKARTVFLHIAFSVPGKVNSLLRSLPVSTVDPYYFSDRSQDDPVKAWLDSHHSFIQNPIKPFHFAHSKTQVLTMTSSIPGILCYGAFVQPIFPARNSLQKYTCLISHLCSNIFFCSPNLALSPFPYSF